MPKSPHADDSDPVIHGIALTWSVYKIYCNVLNTRLCNWVEMNGKSVDEQNGLRKKYKSNL